MGRLQLDSGNLQKGYILDFKYKEDKEYFKYTVTQSLWSIRNLKELKNLITSKSHEGCSREKSPGYSHIKNGRRDESRSGGCM